MVFYSALQPSTLTQTDSPAVTAKPGRLLSLDVFRGGTIASMILVNNQVGQAYPQLRHAQWHGWTFTDLVFPFFLWIVGVALTFSFGKRIERGDSKAILFRHIVVRSAAIFGIGLLLNGFPYYDLTTIRVPGVLQRIAVCYLCAATLFLFFRLRARIVWTVSLLTIYWLAMKFTPVPGCGTNNFSIDCNMERYIDGLMLSGHMYSQTKTWDPEGIISTLPAICNALLGIFAGELLKSRQTMQEKTAWMFLGGNLLIFSGMMLSTWMPINKQLWTVSYALFTSGLAFVVFACCYWLVDVQGWRRWTKPWVIYGMNALGIYILSGLLARLLGLIKPFTGPEGSPVLLSAALWRNVYQPLASPEIASFLYGLSHVAVLWLIAYWFYRRNWVFKV